MQENIKKIAFGCRLNALECEKIAALLSPYFECAAIVNTCSVTAEAERQCAQAVRKLRRENPDMPIFITGCGATRAPEIFASMGTVVANGDKMKKEVYLTTTPSAGQHQTQAEIQRHPPTPLRQRRGLSKAFIQIQNGCDWKCAYCITRILRGPAVSFPYDAILADINAAIRSGFNEIVLTGIDIASYVGAHTCAPGREYAPLQIAELCERLLHDVPDIKRLRLSSMDPASPEIPKIIELMKRDKRMMPHLHLSMQSGSNTILHKMLRRHSVETVIRNQPPAYAGVTGISYSWDIICGFPDETDELFAETIALARELKPIKIHAFPFSPRPGTAAADMPNQIPRDVSKKRVKMITEIAAENLREFMMARVGTVTSILVENKNIARTPDDIEVQISGAPIPPRTICDVLLTGVENGRFTGLLR